MAQAATKIGKTDIDKFIVELQYGEEGWKWPRSTIVLSKVKIHYATGEEDTFNWIHRNMPGNQHAEKVFLAELNNKIAERQVTRIEAKLVQNYSPCNTSGCANDILRFKEDMKQQGIIFSLTIKFANFYRHTTESNKEGLTRLWQNDVILELLQGEDSWKEFLNDENFVGLTEDEYKELLNRATSDERTDRETEDVEILSEITSEASDDTGLEDLIDNLSIQSSNSYDNDDDED